MTTVNSEAPAAEDLVADWLTRFNAALAAQDAGAASECFAVAGYWRDLVSLTWNLKTVEGRDGIRDMLANTLSGARPREFRACEPPTETDGVIESWLEFETEVGRGRGHLRLRDGLAWTLLTTLQELKGHEERRGVHRPLGAEHGVRTGRRTWLENREAELAEIGRSRQPEVLIVGGGQGGIALAARLRQLDVPTIVVDRHARPGDQWRNRYKSLCLHDPVWYDHLPYLKFPDNWPVFSPKDKLADWLEMYVRVMELDYWGATEAVAASYDESGGVWKVRLSRDGEELWLRPRQLVLATGMAGVPNRPRFPGEEVFRGEIQHSSEHPGPEAYTGRRVVVVGSNNSAFDICGALYEVGADVTMVQRSSTHIARSETLMEMALAPLYSEEALASGVSTEQADMIVASLPYRILPEVQIPLTEQMRRRDSDYYARLQEAGFELDWGPDGSGLLMKYLRRGGGYYIDVGAAELIADGSIKLAHGQVHHLIEDAVVLEDGTELPADLVVYATGYRSMNEWAAELISRDVADQLGKVWGLGSGTPKDPGPWEGELRNMWKPTQVPALWLHGGNLYQSRFYSLFLALQLKARQVGIPTPVYGLQEVHHTS